MLILLILYWSGREDLNWEVINGLIDGVIKWLKKKKNIKDFFWYHKIVTRKHKTRISKEQDKRVVKEY